MGTTRHDLLGFSEKLDAIENAMPDTQQVGPMSGQWRSSRSAVRSSDIRLRTCAVNIAAVQLLDEELTEKNQLLEEKPSRRHGPVFPALLGKIRGNLHERLTKRRAHMENARPLSYKRFFRDFLPAWRHGGYQRDREMDIRKSRTVTMEKFITLEAKDRKMCETAGRFVKKCPG